ncbi:hypothetical protein E1171_01425 [Cytophagales bacterium RKSG123]|nr:hypothetical protein [Xanthovirga aplysinae]
MSNFTRFLPGFKATYISVGALYVLLAGSLFLRGIPESMAQFNVPSEILNSPHYLDAMLWTYSHMIILGLVIGLMGFFAEGVKLKGWMSGLLLLANAYYTLLDFRSSDSNLGNGLYEGEASLIPAIIALGITMLFLQLVVRNVFARQALGIKEG